MILLPQLEYWDYWLVLLLLDQITILNKRLLNTSEGKKQYFGGQKTGWKSYVNGLEDGVYLHSDKVINSSEENKAPWHIYFNISMHIWSKHYYGVKATIHFSIHMNIKTTWPKLRVVSNSCLYKRRYPEPYLELLFQPCLSSYSWYEDAVNIAMQLTWRYFSLLSEDGFQQGIVNENVLLLKGRMCGGHWGVLLRESYPFIKLTVDQHCPGQGPVVYFSRVCSWMATPVFTFWYTVTYFGEETCCVEFNSVFLHYV